MDLAMCLGALGRAIEAAGQLGLRTVDAEETRRRIQGRRGYPGDLYVLALVGGTGVGKSSLLNALAGEPISRAGALRPTTETPYAWVPSARAGEAASLIDWLGGAEQRQHDVAALRDVVVLDLPDLDSITRDHRARVDAVLPRIDAVAWVSDPEKYQDAVLHDEYLRRWMPVLTRQVIVINKVDRVAPADIERLRRDLANRLESEGGGSLAVLVTAAAPGGLGRAYGGITAMGGPTPDIGELRSWITEGVDAKRIVTGRLAAEAREAVLAMASDAGVPLDGTEPGALIHPGRREAATRETVARTMAVADLAGLARQAEEATRAAARPRGGGPIGLLRSVLERGSGLHERRADPAGYLRRWRERGSLVSAGEPLRELVTSVVTSLPSEARPVAAGFSDSAAVTTSLAAAVDRAVGGEAAAFEPPRSRLWGLLGLAQLVATATLILGVIWMIALLAGVGRAETPLVTLPVLGPVPTPVLLVAAGLLGWFLLGRLLGLHAGWLGRRWAGRLRARVASEVDQRVTETVLAPFRTLEEARATMARAVRDVLACGHGNETGQTG